MLSTLELDAASKNAVAYRDVRHFGSLDGLRALSVIAVVWHHTVGHDPRLPSLFSAGAHGVTLFFAISGFLITTLLLREQQRRGIIDLRAFYIRRALRIFPLYYAVVLVYVVLVLVLEKNSPAGREFIGNLVFFITYTSNWFVVLEGRVIFYFAWSLAAEEQFYLLWPSVQRFFTPRRALAVMLTFITTVIGLQWWLANAIETASRPQWWHQGVVDFPLAICFGVVLAHLLHGARGYRALRWVFGFQPSSAIWAVALLLALGWGRSALAIHLVAALFVGSCVYREDHVLAPVLRWRPLVFIGSVSYGVYLLHMLVKNAAVRVLASVGAGDARYLVFVLTLLGAVAFAALSFRYFESIFLRKKLSYTTA